MKNPTLEFDLGSADEALMQQLVAQEPEALRDLYHRHRTVLRAVVMRVVHDEADADEVLQDVFVQLWQRANHYSRDRGQPIGWLITLAHRRAIDRLRQRHAYRRATQRFECECQRAPKQGCGDRSGDGDADRDDLRDYLKKLLMRLPEAQRQVLECAYFKGMSQRQIAAALELPLGTVKTRIELGLKKLAQVVLAARSKVA